MVGTKSGFGRAGSKQKLQTSVSTRNHSRQDIDMSQALCARHGWDFSWPLRPVFHEPCSSGEHACGTLHFFPELRLCRVLLARMTEDDERRRRIVEARVVLQTAWPGCKHVMARDLRAREGEEARCRDGNEQGDLRRASIQLILVCILLGTFCRLYTSKCPLVAARFPKVWTLST